MLYLLLENEKRHAFPVIIIFKKGKEMKRYIGLTAKERLIADLEEILKH